MKKVLILLVLSSLSFSVFAEAKLFYVALKEGITIFNEPSAFSGTSGTLKYLEKVTADEFTVNKENPFPYKDSQWAKINAGKKSGWVFLKELGTDPDEIRKCNYYSGLWKCIDDINVIEKINISRIFEIPNRNMKRCLKFSGYHYNDEGITKPGKINKHPLYKLMDMLRVIEGKAYDFNSFDITLDGGPGCISNIFTFHPEGVSDYYHMNMRASCHDIDYKYEYTTKLRKVPLPVFVTTKDITLHSVPMDEESTVSGKINQNEKVTITEYFFKYSDYNRTCWIKVASKNLSGWTMQEDMADSKFTIEECKKLTGSWTPQYELIENEKIPVENDRVISFELKEQGIKYKDGFFEPYCMFNISDTLSKSGVREGIYTRDEGLRWSPYKKLKYKCTYINQDLICEEKRFSNNILPSFELEMIEQKKYIMKQVHP